MDVKYDNLGGYFYASNPHVDAQGRLTFTEKNCTHFIIVSAAMDDEMNLSKNDIMSHVDSKAFSESSSDLNVGKYKVRIVKRAAYIASGNFITGEKKATCHAVYGCVYDDAEETLNISLPGNPEDAVVYIPITVLYRIKRQMTAEKRGFLGIGKKTSEFTGIYIIHIDDIADYPDGCIYYTVGNYKYYITKEMLGKDIFIKPDKQKTEPELHSINNEIKLVKNA